MVPPREMILETDWDSISKKSRVINPEKPFLIPVTFTLLYMALLTMARIAAFMPGASPPEVRIPIRLMLLFFM
jgi:hypothetical protein